MSDDDGMDPSTRVLVVMCTWVPVTASYRVRQLMPLLLEDPALVAHTSKIEPRHQMTIFSHIEHFSHKYLVKVKVLHKWSYFHTMSIFHTNIQ
jgi:hypothetical protein